MPVRERLSTAIREDVEAALKADRQLGEQVAQVLASRRFDSETRAQVVRLINDRAQQLVPAAAKRVINEWTQTTLAAHRSKTQNAESAAAHTDLVPAEAFAAVPRLQSGQTRQPSARKDSLGKSATRVDYRKLSDEQILEL